MNRYECSAPRAALGLSAVAMAAITIGALVVLPAKFDSISATVEQSLRTGGVIHLVTLLPGHFALP